MDAELLCPSNYIKAVEFDGKDVTFTITKVETQELDTTQGTKKTKGIASLLESKKQWVLNRTNVECLKAMWGRETDEWLGKRVTLWAEPNNQSDTGVAIRVRGSPDLQKDITFELKLPRKKPAMVVLKKIGRAGGKPGPAAAPPEPKKELAYDRLIRVAKEMGQEHAVKEGLEKFAPGSKKKGDVTDPIVDRILAWMVPSEPPEPGSDQEDALPA